MEEISTKEVLVELRELKERIMEFHVQTNQHFTTIDASLSALAPMITAHQERFKLVKMQHDGLCEKVASNTGKINRMEMGIFGIVFMLLTAAIAWIWTNISNHVFVPIK
jgi:hypothetical protein